ncbi:methionyl-tRNA formyltransferase, partial [Candidatus Saccharibacteria bacterium]|nr:methionyl-tRNA formyltransferase [Candidatus Saccharibacteria bacterium]
YKLMSEEGARLLIENLQGIIEGSLKPQEQDEEQATYSHLLKKADGLIDWQSETAQQIERKVRAYLGFPKTRATIWNKHEVILTKVRLAEHESDGNLVMKCSDGYVELLELIAPSGRLMSGADFKLGHKN